MDPFLETRWADVHHRLVQYSCDRIQEALPLDLRARVEERVYVEYDHDKQRQIAPDVSIYQPGPQRPYELRESAVAVAEPMIFVRRGPPVKEGYVEIRERGGGKLITVVEFLSPGNKNGGAGEQKYLEKQQDVLLSAASLVEIDLVRAGRRVLALAGVDIPAEFRNDYLACISPGWDRDLVELYRMRLRERLSILPIPLRKAEARVPLDLQALIDEAYMKGAHDDLDYSHALEPPLPQDEAVWVQNILQNKAAT